MSKKFKKGLCVYCAENQAETADHVFARQFLAMPRRGNLPKVPACRECNGEKAKLEHYLATVLPFGGRHADATPDLEAVAPRLAKNARLHRELSAGQSRVMTREPSGLYVPTMALPFDGSKLTDLFVFIVKGLAWHHWKVVIEPQSSVEAFNLTKFGEGFFSQFSAIARVSGNLGAGALSYEGAQGADNPQVSVWTFTVFGGITLAGDPEAPDIATSKIGAFTAPTKIFDKAAWLSGRAGSPI